MYLPSGGSGGDSVLGEQFTVQHVNGIMEYVYHCPALWWQRRGLVCWESSSLCSMWCALCKWSYGVFLPLTRPMVTCVLRVWLTIWYVNGIMSITHPPSGDSGKD